MNNPIKVKIENDNTSGCLFFIFIVLVVIAYQLITMGWFLKETLQTEKHIQQCEVKK